MYHLQILSVNTIRFFFSLNSSSFKFPLFIGQNAFTTNATQLNTDI